MTSGSGYASSTLLGSTADASLFSPRRRLKNSLFFFVKMDISRFSTMAGTARWLCGHVFVGKVSFSLFVVWCLCSLPCVTPSSPCLRASMCWLVGSARWYADTLLWTWVALFPPCWCSCDHQVQGRHGPPYLCIRRYRIWTHVICTASEPPHLPPSPSSLLSPPSTTHHHPTLDGSAHGGDMSGCPSQQLWRRPLTTAFRREGGQKRTKPHGEHLLHERHHHHPPPPPPPPLPWVRLCVRVGPFRLCIQLLVF